MREQTWQEIFDLAYIDARPAPQIVLMLQGVEQVRAKGKGIWNQATHLQGIASASTTTTSRRSRSARGPATASSPCGWPTSTASADTRLRRGSSSWGSQAGKCFWRCWQV